jgi:hypothetical protein
MTTLGIDIRNPYVSTRQTMHVSSDPLRHHRVAGGDFSIDINMPGRADAGKRVAFDVVPTGDARRVRGIVELGGSSPWIACASGDPNDGGWGIKLRLEARGATEDWQHIGTFSVLHLEDIPGELGPGATVEPGDSLGAATGRFGGRCSTGPHIHCEASSVDGATVPMARLGDPLSESSIVFSLAITSGHDDAGPEDAGLPEDALRAGSLSAYYRAMGRSLPSRAVRGRIYAAMGLGASARYRGTATQNTALLRALKERAIAPRAVDDVA